MENAIENLLNVKVKKLNKSISGGCVNSASVYQTEDNKLLFVKQNSNDGSEKMFYGELESLKAIRSTKTVLVPNPIATAELGSQLADMHLNNLQGEQPNINQFGFHVETCCGFLPQNNTWTNDWLTFFIENRLAYQIQLLQSNSDHSSSKKKVIENYWPQLKQIIPKFFEGIKVKPSLVHGDLWSGNAAQTNLKSVIFDPAAFYGHHEYDIASTTLFGGYSNEFYDAYFRKIPKENGFEYRMSLYHLFHYLNHWNHFGGQYISSTINTFEECFNAYKYL
ncbi:Hypothetical protein CINCED_3A004193 [Cinara cedri]|uniref:protein-ribulosamine 3-kinase n=1 Tax=Cinara cedri TaxID=506608 RepID=A0A5E4NKM4_9HEMI|nr:Hypothetical protein CINCED_3A004193 [Cinara cedri]